MKYAICGNRYSSWNSRLKSGLSGLLLTLGSINAFAISHDIEVTLKFTAPTERADGSQLRNSDILFYRINYGNSADPNDATDYIDFDNPGAAVVEYRTVLAADRLPDWPQVCVNVTSVVDDGLGGERESEPSNVECRDTEPEEPKAGAVSIDDFEGEVSGEFFPWDIRLTWSAPNERLDGTELPLDQISHYRVYYTQFANDPINENWSKKLKNPGVDQIVWRFTVTDTQVATWTSLCARVRSSVFTDHTTTEQSDNSNTDCHVFSEPEPPEPLPVPIIDLEADTVNIKANVVNILPPD